MLRKTVIGILVVAMLAALISGCSGARQDVTPGDGDSKPVAGGEVQQDKENEVMSKYEALSSKEVKASEMLGFIKDNIPSVSKENASKMLIRLEELQKAELPKLDERYSGDENVQRKLREIYTPDFDLSKLDGIEDEALRSLLTETREGGFKIDTAEGMYFPVIDYGCYEPFAQYVTGDMADYIKIMKVESDKAPAKDAAIVISWEEVLSRAAAQEKFLAEHKDSAKAADMKQLYYKYLTFALYGANNTPLFSYDTKTFSPEARPVYERFMGNGESSSFNDTIKNYMEVVKSSNYKLSDEIESFRKNALESLNK